MKFVILLSDIIKIILGCTALTFFVWFAKTFGIKDDKEKKEKVMKLEADKDDQNSVR